MPGFKTFTFENNHGIVYQAGQYLTLLLHHNAEDIRRSYSITSSPVLQEPLSIGVRRQLNGFFSRYLFDTITVGMEIQTIGSGGLFILPLATETYRQVFFFAAGSGITPIFSLIKETLYSQLNIQVLLIYSNTSKERTIFYDELVTLQEQFKERFDIRFLFSNSSALYYARLHRDLLLSIIHKNALSDKQNVLFYVCGPEAYMRFCIYTLQEEGFGKNNIKRENFVVAKIAQRTTHIPDQNTHSVQVTYGADTYSFKVVYPDTILRAARKEGISLPYSCESGQCGNCVAQCLSGKVWHALNEVLTEKDLAEGLILTCVGHPVGEDLVLKIG